MPPYEPVSSGAQSAGRRIRSARRSGGAACSSNFVSLQFCAVMGALMPTRATRPIVLLCFFASGVAGLIYEVVWGKYLALLLGHTAQAHTIVLATFMGGLALGNYAFGRLADEVWPHQAPWPRPLAGHRGRAQYRGWRDRVRKKNEEPEGVRDVPGLKADRSYVNEIRADIEQQVAKAWRKILVDKQLHLLATATRRRSRSAANARQARTSSWVRSGKSRSTWYGAGAPPSSTACLGRKGLTLRCALLVTARPRGTRPAACACGAGRPQRGRGPRRGL